MTEDAEVSQRGTWDNIKRSLQEGASVVMGKAEELTQTGRARLDVAASKARVGRLQAVLGERVYELLESGGDQGVAEDAEVRSLCEQIREAQAEVSDGEAALDQIRAELQDGDASTA